jgi:co-chaperonin GroES (HSP10)
MKPINNRFIVKKLEEKETIGVLELPNTLDPQTAIAYGTVEAIPEVMLTAKGEKRECPLKVKDKVIFNIWCQQVRKENGEIIYFPTEQEVIALVE